MVYSDSKETAVSILFNVVSFYLLGDEMGEEGKSLSSSACLCVFYFDIACLCL